MMPDKARPISGRGQLRLNALLSIGLYAIALAGFLACLVRLLTVDDECWATGQPTSCHPHALQVLLALLAFAGCVLIAQLTNGIAWRSHQCWRWLLAGCGLEAVIAGTVYVTVFASRGAS